MNQSIFDFPPLEEFYEEDFIISYSNLEAYNAINHSENWADKRLLLVGEAGSGKSHIARIFSHKANAVFINLPLDLTAMHKGNLILEDIHNIADQDSLFHIINFCKNNQTNLLLTASELPEFSLADLQSRINATAKVFIKPPDEILFRAILHKQFFQRQINLDKEILDYLSVRLTRGYTAIKEFVAMVDQYSLVSKRRITIPLIKKVLTIQDAKNPST
jgi:chromosomal replication initiation ATPase DnaA